jgi:hypothetical protein
MVVAPHLRSTVLGWLVVVSIGLRSVSPVLGAFVLVS